MKMEKRLLLPAGGAVLLAVGCAAAFALRGASPPASRKTQNPSGPPGAASPAVLSSAAVSAGAASAPSSAPQTDLSGSVMLGNSFVDDLNTLGLIPEMDFYDRIGLSVSTVFTRPTATGKVPVIDELKGKQYKRVYLLFGENELGWQGTKAFTDAYARVVDAVRARQPKATVYIQSVFPISANVSAKNEDNTNNARIREYNAQLRALAARKGAVYLDVASVLADARGDLPDGAAPDGVHPTKKYDRLWVNYLRTHDK